MPGIEGTTFAGFEILHKLGQGGMGAVYKARQIGLNRIVALKVMAGNLGQDEDYVHRFRREAASAAKIDHPNAVKVFAFGEEGGTHYIAMEYIEGETLRGRIERLGRLEPGEALAIAEQVGSALGYAWDNARLIHRDIKPDNIFLTRGGEAKVGDLGLAKSVGGASTGLTATGAMMGSPHYISPEQGRGDGDVDFRADIYSLGCTLYHMLTGKTPYEAENIYALIHMHVYDAPPAIFRVWPECPTRLGTLVGKMLSKKREQRPASYAELLGELGAVRQWLEDRRSGAIAQAAATPVAQPAPARQVAPAAKAKSAGPNIPMLAGIGVAALLLVGGLAWMVGGRSRSGGKAEPPPPTVEDRIAWATKENPFVNSLGMKFVPVPGTTVLFSIWETRGRDWEAFVKASGYTGGERVRFGQTPDHPVGNVSWENAKAFCAWLSKRDGQEYRLPTDDEWSATVRSIQYPWGDDWPPPQHAGNLAGAEALLGEKSDPKEMVAGRKDPFPRTAPVGLYRASRDGLYDLSGNMWEWCEDWHTDDIYAKHIAAGGYEFSADIRADIAAGKARRVLRGGGWNSGYQGGLRSGSRMCHAPDEHHLADGFRCVLVISPRAATARASVASQTDMTLTAGSLQTEAQASSLATATKDNPFINSLGMKFVPVPGTEVLFSVYETRVRDWQTFLTESGYAWNENAGFEQTPDHPVVRVSWDDAKAFCAWLSKKEGREYRLPTDDEWSAAVGTGKYPWGDEWPPPAGAGNFPGEESKLGKGDDPKPEWMCAGWKDAHARTAAAGSYRANRYGLHDLAGNVREWCEDWYDAAILEKRRAEAGIGDPSDPKELAEAKQGNVRRVARGGSWCNGLEGHLRSADRGIRRPDVRGDYYGYRCVVGRSASSP